MCYFYRNLPLVCAAGFSFAFFGYFFHATAEPKHKRWRSYGFICLSCSGRSCSNWRTSTGNYALPYNGQTGRRYNGINRFILMFQALEKGYYTFKQVTELGGCKVRAGEKATAVECWLMWDSKEKRSVTFPQYAQLRRDNPERKEDEFWPYSKTAYIFECSTA